MSSSPYMIKYNVVQDYLNIISSPLVLPLRRAKRKNYK